MKKWLLFGLIAGLLTAGGFGFGAYSMTGNLMDTWSDPASGAEPMDIEPSTGSLDLEMKNEHEVKLPKNEEDEVYFNNHGTFDLSRSTEEKDIAFQSGQQASAKRAIADLHESMNDLTGYGKIETFDHEKLRAGEYHDHKHFREQIMNLKEKYLDDSRALKDLHNLKMYYTMGISIQSEDRVAMRYAHRIIHDLDVHVNGDGHEDDRTIWGVTEAFGEDKRIEEMYSYIRDHAN